MTNNELAGHILAAIQRHILHSAEVSARTARHEGELGHIRSAVGHWEGARKRRECAEMVSRIPARVVEEAMGETTAGKGGGKRSCTSGRGSRSGSRTRSGMPAWRPRS